MQERDQLRMKREAEWLQALTKQEKKRSSESNESKLAGARGVSEKKKAGSCLTVEPRRLRLQTHQQIM